MTGAAGNSAVLVGQGGIGSARRPSPSRQWVTVEVEVHGDKTIKHIIDGKVILSYDQPQLDPRDPDAAKLIDAADGKKLLSEGYISLQSESHPVEFRKVELLPLEG